MESKRQNRIARLIQKDLSNIFQAQTRMTRGILISVSGVKISPDLSVAKAYLSIFPSEKSQDILENINNHASQIRYELGKLERHQLRIIPELRFFIDDTLDYIENIDRLIDEEKASMNIKDEEEKPQLEETNGDGVGQPE